jgi:hypothetical protein
MRTRANALPGALGVAIADAVQTVPVGATGVDRDWRNAAKAGEGTFRAQWAAFLRLRPATARRWQRRCQAVLRVAQLQR